MSAIGDYIHLTSLGYTNPQPKRNGILPHDYTNSMIKESDALSVFMAQKRNIDAIVAARGNTATAEQIEKRIKKLQAFNENDPEEAKIFYNTLIQKIQEDLEVTLSETLLASPADGSDDEIIKKLRNNIKKVQDAQNVANMMSKGSVSIEETLLPLAQQIKTILKQIEDKKLDTENIKDAESKINNITAYLENFISAFNSYNNSTGKKTRTLFNVRENKLKSAGTSITINSVSNSPSISVADFVGLVKQLAKDLGYSLSKKQGDAAELVVATASAMGYTAADKKLDEIFKVAKSNNILTGKNSGQVIYKNNKNALAESISHEIGDGYIIDDYSGIIVSQGASQDKVDVKFYLNSEEPAFNTSVKNYKLNTVKKFGFGGVSGSPFLYLAQQIQNNNFINHWINSTILHTKEAGSVVNDSTGKYYGFAHGVMKYTLVIIGAIGGLNKVANGVEYKQDTADYLVWNDPTSKNGMRVFAFSDIFKNIYEDIANNFSGQWSESYDKNFMSSNWSIGRMLKEAKNEGNKKVYQQIRRRTQKALIYMHQAKISTKFFLNNKFLPS